MVVGIAAVDEEGDVVGAGIGIAEGDGAGGGEGAGGACVAELEGALADGGGGGVEVVPGEGEGAGAGFGEGEEGVVLAGLAEGARVGAGGVSRADDEGLEGAVGGGAQTAPEPVRPAMVSGAAARDIEPEVSVVGHVGGIRYDLALGEPEVGASIDGDIAGKVVRGIREFEAGCAAAVGHREAAGPADLSADTR